MARIGGPMKRHSGAGWFFVMALLTALLRSTTAMGAGAPQTRHLVDLRILPDGVVQQLTLSDGSRLYGRVESIDGAAVVFRTIGGATTTVTTGDITDLR